MAVKLNLSTPPADIIKTLIEEGPKCRRWYVKRSGGEDKLEEKMQQLFKTCIANHNGLVLTKPIDYNPTSGNHWVGFEYAIPIEGTMRFRRSFEAGVVWETEGYFGMFYHAGDEHDDKRDTFIFTPHFFQRYCERMNVDSLGLATLQGFLSENDCYRIAFYEKDGEKRIYLRLHKCIGLGKVLSETPLVAEIRTVISDAMMSSNQLTETEQMRKEYDELVADRFTASEEWKEDARLEMKFQDMKSQIGTILKVLLTESRWNKIISYENGLNGSLKLYSLINPTLGNIIGKKLEDGDLLVDKFTIEEFLKILKVILSAPKKYNLQFCLTTYSEMILKVAWHNQFSDITLEQIQEQVRIHYDNNSYNKYQQNKENLMNQQSVTMFKNLLSRTGLTKKFSKYSSGIDDNTDRYLMNAEPIYVITRFLDSIVDIKDKEKFIAANKTWMQLVVENGFCPQLKTYIDQHGKQMVADAICYLIDNNLWISPEDKKGLKKQQPDTFKGLEDIPSAVEYLKENQPENTEKEESIEPVVEFVEEQPTTEPAPSVPTISNVSEELQNARNAADKIINAMVLLTESAKSIKDYVEHDDIGSLYEEENKKLKATLKEQEYVSSREIAALNNKLNDKVEEIKTSQAKLHAEEKARKEEMQRAYDARQERAAMATELDDVKKQLRKAVADLDELRSKAKEATVTSLVTYRVSELEDITLVGPSILKDLVPLLEKKRGVIVIRDGKKWDDGVRHNKSK